MSAPNVCDRLHQLAISAAESEHAAHDEAANTDDAEMKDAAAELADACAALAKASARVVRASVHASMGNAST